MFPHIDFFWFFSFFISIIKDHKLFTFIFILSPYGRNQNCQTKLFFCFFYFTQTVFHLILERHFFFSKSKLFFCISTDRDMFTLKIYNELLRLTPVLKNPTLALQYFQEMQLKRIDPDPTTCFQLLRNFIKQPSDVFLKIFQSLKMEQLQLDIRSYRLLMKCFADRGTKLIKNENIMESVIKKSKHNEICY